MKTPFLTTLLGMALLVIVGCSGDKDKEGKSTGPKSRTPDETAALAKKTPPPAAASRTKKVKAPAVGTVAPEITAKDTDGEVFNLSDYRGKVVMLDFWGNW